MNQSTNIVCPHCNTINRLPAAQLAEGPDCDQCKQPLFDAMPATLTGAALRTHIQHNDIPTVVDFWAPWCAPCRMMEPVFEQAAAQLEPKMRLVKLNIDEAQRTADRFDIEYIPTLIIFKHGREIARRESDMKLARLLRWIEKKTR